MLLETSDERREKMSRMDGSRLDGNRVGGGAAFYGIDKLEEFKLN